MLDFAKERTCEKPKSGFIFMESHSNKFKLFFSNIILRTTFLVSNEAKGEETTKLRRVFRVKIKCMVTTPNCQIYCYPTWLFSVRGPIDMLPCNEILSLRHDFVLKLI